MTKEEIRDKFKNIDEYLGVMHIDMKNSKSYGDIYVYKDKSSLSELLKNIYRLFQEDETKNIIIQNEKYTIYALRRENSDPVIVFFDSKVVLGKVLASLK